MLDSTHERQGVSKLVVEETVDLSAPCQRLRVDLGVQTLNLSLHVLSKISQRSKNDTKHANFQFKEDVTELACKSIRETANVYLCTFAYQCVLTS